MASSIEHNSIKHDLLNVFFKSGTVPAGVYVGLRYSPDGGSTPTQPPAATDTMTTITAGCEVSGGGYARQPVTLSSATLAASGNTYVLTLPQVSFSFTSTPGTNPSATHAFLCTGSSATDNTGDLLISGVLGATRSLGSGVTEQVTLTYTLS